MGECRVGSRVVVPGSYWYHTDQSPADLFFQILALFGPHLGSAPGAKVQLGQALFVRVEHFVNLGFPWREGG